MSWIHEPRPDDEPWWVWAVLVVFTSVLGVVSLATFGLFAWTIVTLVLWVKGT